jgi:hypothetical protein
MRIFPELAALPDVPPVKNGFWKRQFHPETTRPQLVFDLTFGVVGPILCFVFDPIVFQGGFAGPPFLPDYQGVVYLFSGVEIILLCHWLASGQGHEVSNALIGGALLNGGLFCLTIAILLFPLSLIGLAVGIGLFGFTPFFRESCIYETDGARCTAMPPNLQDSRGRQAQLVASSSWPQFRLFFLYKSDQWSPHRSMR